MGNCNACNDSTKEKNIEITSEENIDNPQDSSNEVLPILSFIEITKRRKKEGQSCPIVKRSLAIVRG